MNGRVTALTGREIVTAFLQKPGREPHAGHTDDDVKEGSRGRQHPRYGTRSQKGPHALPVHRGDHRGRPRYHRRSGRARLRGRAEADRHRVREPDQDDDLADHLLHDRARYRFGTEGRQGRCCRRYRADLLHDHVAGRAGHRPGRRQHPGPGHRPRRDRRGQGRRPRAGRRGGQGHHRVPARHHPDHVRLRLHRGRGAPDPADRPARRFRAAGHGPGRTAGPARCRAHPAARLPGPGHGHVGGPGRRLRRDGRRRRLRGRGRAQGPRAPDGRLLHHLRPVRLHRARHAAAAGRGPEHPDALQVPGP
ncbi:hypothetical protein RKD19_002672 [Streptomyces canus]